MSGALDAPSGALGPANCRESILRELALGPRLLIALFAIVHSRNSEASCHALRTVHTYGMRIDCPELATWCDEAQQYALSDLDRLELMLPALVRIWERTQNALVARAFPRSDVVSSGARQSPPYSRNLL